MSAPPVIAVTGANGYVGRSIVRAVSMIGDVVPLVRVPKHEGDRAWSLEMSERQMRHCLMSSGVTHLVHVAWDMRVSSREQSESTCVSGTRRLLDAAKEASVRQFIFISTISAFDGASSLYGRSKLAAERTVLERGGLVLRLGLVYGDNQGGMFGSLSRHVARSPVVPLIHGGPGRQFLLHEDSLSAAIVRAIRGEFDEERRLLTLAHPTPVLLKDLMTGLAAREGRRVVFIPVPWRLVYCALRCLERLHLNVGITSDSLVSFVFQNPSPDFTPLADNKISMVPFYGVQVAPSVRNPE